MTPHPLIIACVKWGERYGAYYVNMLYDMVRRNLSQDIPFHCFTDNPSGLHPAIVARELPGDLTGWWNKLALFREGVFAPDQRIAYFDLDTLILGSLDRLLHYTGNFTILRDFYRPHGYGSGVMLWRAGACYSLWSDFEAQGRPLLDGGDQAWIEKAWPGAHLLQDHLPGLFASFKTDCHPLPPAGTSVVCFHGEPKQDNCGAVWVRELWKPGGRYDASPSTIAQESLAHRRHAAGLPYPWLQSAPAHSGRAVIIGGGPMLDECLEELREQRKTEVDVFAVNNSPVWLADAGITFDAQVISGTCREDAAWVTGGIAACYCASTCHPSVIEKAATRVVLWDPAAVKGRTTGLQAIMLAHALGYRHFDLYGFDSCFGSGRRNAYAQQKSEGERVFHLELQGRKFHLTAWMSQQADEFMALANTLLQQGCSITIHGDGLLHFLATQEATCAGGSRF